jgi:hypothetical protein
VRFRVEAWDPDYGSSSEADPLTPAEPVDADIECPAARWAPVSASELAPEPVVLFVDGVRRTDAYGWINDDAPCAFASYAAGVVRCDSERAVVTDYEIGRGVAAASPDLETVNTTCGEFRPIKVRDGTPEQLNTAIQKAMTAIEVRVSFAARVGDPDALLVVDGPLRERRHTTHVVGLIKRHYVRYLGDLDGVVGALSPGERTPVFLIPSQWGKYSWYLRLPGPDDGPWSGVVRIEAPSELAPAAVIDLADRTAATLGRYASAAHKDGRAPQNLYPIGGLERTLRHRLGDPAFVLRSLRAAAALQRAS